MAFSSCKSHLRVLSVLSRAFSQAVSTYRHGDEEAHRRISLCFAFPGAFTTHKGHWVLLRSRESTLSLTGSHAYPEGTALPMVAHKKQEPRRKSLPTACLHLCLSILFSNRNLSQITKMTKNGPYISHYPRGLDCLLWRPLGLVQLLPSVPFLNVGALLLSF